MTKNIARTKNLPENEINGEIAFKLMEQGDYIQKFLLSAVQSACEKILSKILIDTFKF